MSKPLREIGLCDSGYVALSYAYLPTNLVKAMCYLKGLDDSEEWRISIKFDRHIAYHSWHPVSNAKLQAIPHSFLGGNNLSDSCKDQDFILEGLADIKLGTTSVDSLAQVHWPRSLEHLTYGVA